MVRVWPSILSGCCGQDVERVGVEYGGEAGHVEQIEEEFFGRGVLAEAGPDGEDGFLLEELLVIQIFGGDLAVGAFGKDGGHEFGSNGGDAGEDGWDDSRGDESRSGAKRGERGHGGSSGLPAGSSDDEHVAVHALVAVGGARRLNEGVGGAGPAEVQAGADGFGRRADGGDDDGAVDASRQVTADMRELGSGEGHDGIGAECAVGGELTGVGVPSRGQVDRDDGGVERVHAIAKGGGDSAERRAEAGADDSIEEQIGVREEGANLGRVERSLVGNEDRREMHLAEGSAGVALQFIGIAEKQHGYFPASGGESAGGYEAVSPVVALAAEDGDAAGMPVFALDEASDGLSRVTHEDDGGNAELLGGDAVGGAHFVSRKNWDGGNEVHASHRT